MPSQADLDQLVEDLRSPDSSVRDDVGLARAADYIVGQVLDPGQCRWLGDRVIEHLDSPEAHVRAFAPLVLAMLADAGCSRPAWVEKAKQWYVEEQDLRGFDDEVGWIHAVAHGADYLGTVALQDLDDPGAVSSTLFERVLGSGSVTFVHGEEDRVAVALAVCLATVSDPALEVESWRQRLEGRVDDHAEKALSNLWRTLRSLYMLVGQTLQLGDASITVRDIGAVREALSRILHLATPWLWEEVDH